MAYLILANFLTVNLTFSLVFVNSFLNFYCEFDGEIFVDYTALKKFYPFFQLNVVILVRSDEKTHFEQDAERLEGIPPQERGNENSPSLLFLGKGPGDG